MEERNKLTREEALRRWNISMQRRKERVDRMKSYLREEYKKMTGEEPKYYEIW